MNINLEKPLIFFDLETTGINIANDRIVEISIVKLLPDGSQEIKTRKINPEMPIPRGASEVHGIYDEDVKDEPTFKDIAKSLYNYMLGCDVAGYNVLKFDIPLLIKEFERANLSYSVSGVDVVDVFNIFCKKEPRTLTAAYKMYCNKDLEDAHSAEADTLATLEVFAGQLKYYDDLPNSISEIAEFANKRDDKCIDNNGRFKWHGDDAMVAFGKHNGQLLKTVADQNPGFLRWIVNNDFPEDVKKIAKNALIGKFPVKK
ncbi:exonuclease domain-containing protein [Lentisphaerota bacterium WC36G]|nr:3'-5' exonuclease [Lentisphaerae bacterium WC36]